jgi:hypothetical protein
MKTPPLLLAATLLFWGWQTELLLFAIIMAIILEGARFVPFKWDFSLSELQRISDLCSIILIGMVIYLFMSRNFMDITFTLFQWLPLTFFPLMLSQCYSISDTLDLRALFLTLRRKSKIQKSPIMMNLTYPYFIICILGAGAANMRTNGFYLGFFTLTVWALWTLRSKRYSTALWISILSLAGIVGYAGHIQIHQWQLALEKSDFLLRLLFGLYQNIDPYRSVTAIGDIGTVKLSNEVIFRVRSETGDLSPLLLREASYNTYDSSSWYASDSLFISIPPEEDEKTWKILSREREISPAPPSEKGETTSTQSSEREKRVTVSSYLIRRAAILRLPTGIFQIENLPVGIMTGNQFGAVKVEEGPGLITYRALFDPHTTVDSPPNENDLSIPEDEQPVIRQLAKELALTSKTPEEVLQTISLLFRKNFSYSLDLDRHVKDITPLADFLLNSRNGHCEYFATATVLLLRSAGIPARYAAGYSVDVLNRPGKWTVVRGRDAHAWTLVYLNGTWHDFDTTPPSWRPIENAAASPFEWFSDLWSQWKFAFSEWRWREREGGTTEYLGWLLIPLSLLLVWRLYKQRRIKRVPKRQEQQIEENLAPGLDSAFYIIEQKLQESGFTRHPWEPLSHWMKRLESDSSLPSIQTLFPILFLHYRYRFDPEGLTQAEKAALHAEVQSWLEQYDTEFSHNED